MKTFTPFILFFLFSLSSFSQSWYQSQSMANGRINAISFSLAGKGYIALGNDGFNHLSDVWQYDPGSATWNAMSNFPSTPRSEGFAFSAGNLAYVGGGWNQANTFYDLYAYDPVTNMWAQKSSYPGKGGRNCLYASVNGKGYVGGGALNADLPYGQDFWEYNPATDSWTQKSDFPFGPRATGVSFGIDSIVYIGLGHNGAISYNDLWAYNPANDTWTKMADFPGVDRTQASYFVINGKAIVGGGFQLMNGFPLSDYYEFDPEMNTWTQISSFANGARSNSRGFAIDDTGYVCIGKDVNGNFLSDLWEYRPWASSINDYKKDIKMVIYPVPGSNELTILYDTEGTLAKFSLYNLNGQLILSKSQNSFSNQIKIDLSELPDGNYNYIFGVKEGKKSGIISIRK
ncbi:MAG: kelch repeat-containing protein [Bacteroidia bacterium]